MSLITVHLGLVSPHGENDVPFVASGRVEFVPATHGKYAGAFRAIETVNRSIVQGAMEPVELTPGAWKVTVTPTKGNPWPTTTFVLSENMSEPVNIVDLTPDFIIDGKEYAKGDVGPAGPPGPSVTGGYPNGDGSITLSLENGSEVGPIMLPAGPQGIQGIQGEQGPQGLQGVKGDTGLKGDPGNLGTTLIYGAGRPDVPATLTPETATTVSSASSGAQFFSTDGANVGAWVWQKRGTTWIVTNGDTGWLDWSSHLPENAADSGLWMRREANNVRAYFSIPFTGTRPALGSFIDWKILASGFVPQYPTVLGTTRYMASIATLLQGRGDHYSGTNWAGQFGLTWDSGDGQQNGRFSVKIPSTATSSFMWGGGEIQYTPKPEWPLNLNPS